jgi:hypothetical protein
MITINKNTTITVITINATGINFSQKGGYSLFVWSFLLLSGMAILSSSLSRE